MANPGWLSALPSKVPNLTADNWAQREVNLFPLPWAGDTARSSVGLLYNLFKAGSITLQDVVGYFKTVEQGTRIKTATGTALDTISLDLFGSDLPRLANETDEAFRARIYANLFLGAITKQAISQAITTYTGNLCRAMEPWCPGDCLVLDRSYVDVDSTAYPTRVGDPALNYQGFIEASILPPSSPAVSSIWTLDLALSYDVAQAVLDLPLGRQSVNLYSQLVDALLLKIRPFGVKVWRKYFTTPAQDEQSGIVTIGGAGSTQLLINTTYPYSVMVQPIDNNNLWWVTDELDGSFILHSTGAGKAQWYVKGAQADTIVQAIAKADVPSNYAGLGFMPNGGFFALPHWSAYTYASAVDVLFSALPSGEHFVDLVLFDPAKIYTLYPDLVGGVPTNTYTATIAGSAGKKIFAIPFWDAQGPLMAYHIQGAAGPTDTFQLKTPSGVLPPSPTSSVQVILDA